MKYTLTLLAASALFSFVGAESQAVKEEKKVAKCECKKNCKKEACGAGCKGKCCSSKKDDAKKVDSKAAVTHFNVSGMTCGGCSKKLTKSLGALKGVSVKKVCHKSGCVDVTLTDGATAKQVEEAIVKAGFTISAAKKK